MKKLFLFLILILSFTITNAQDTTDKITETERIVDKYSDKVVDGFNELIKKVTPVAEDAFEIAVRLQIAEGLARLIPLFMLPLIWLILRNVIKKSKWRPNGDADNGYAILQIVLWVILCIDFIAFIITIYGAIVRLVAPEWFAIKEILNLIN